MIEFEVQNMSCGHCIASVTKTVKQTDPSAEVQVDLKSKRVRVESTEERATFARALTEAGYPTV